MYCILWQCWSLCFNKFDLIWFYSATQVKLTQTGETSLDEKHLRFSSQRFAVYVVEKLYDVEDANWFRITRVQQSELAMREYAADERVVIGMVNARRLDHQQTLENVPWQIRVNFHTKLQLLKQFSQNFCQITNKPQKTTDATDAELTNYWAFWALNGWMNE